MPTKHWQVGKNKVFLRQLVYEPLEDKRHTTLNSAAVKLQSMVRMFVKRKRKFFVIDLILDFNVIQLFSGIIIFCTNIYIFVYLILYLIKCYFNFLICFFIEYKRIRAAAVTIQFVYKTRRLRLMFIRKRRAAIVIQSSVRGMFAREVQLITMYYFS